MKKKVPLPWINFPASSEYSQKFILAFCTPPPKTNDDEVILKLIAALREELARLDIELANLEFLLCQKAQREVKRQ